MKQGDLAPKLVIDTNADVTGATSKVAKIRRRHDDTGPPATRTHPTVMTKTLTTQGDPTLGVLEYQWVGPDTDVAGTYEIEALVTFTGGVIQRFPGKGVLEWVIEEKVG